MGRFINYVSSHKGDRGSLDIKVYLQANLSISIIIGLTPPWSILPDRGTHTIPSTHNGSLNHPKTIPWYTVWETHLLGGLNRCYHNNIHTPNLHHSFKNLTNLLLYLNFLHNLSLTLIKTNKKTICYWVTILPFLLYLFCGMLEYTFNIHEENKLSSLTCNYGRTWGIIST